MILGLTLAIAGIVVCFGWFLWVWNWESRRALIFTPFLIFCLNEIFRNWFAGLYAPLVGRADDYYAMFVMLGAFVTFLGGFVLFAGSEGYRSNRPKEYRERPLGQGGLAPYLISVGVVGAVLLGAALYLFEGFPPFLTAIRSWWEGSLEAEVARYVGAKREELTKGHYFGGQYRGQGAIRSLGRIGWPMLTGTVLLLYLRERRRSLAAITVGFLVLQFAVLAGDGTRGPFIWSLVYLVILLSFVISVRVRQLLVAGTVTVAILVGMSLLSPKMFNVLGQEGIAQEVARRVSERILVGNGLNTVAVIELVREGFWSLRGGAVHLQRLTVAIPGIRSSNPFTYELYLALNPGGTATTYLSATYLGDLYIDFGLVGALSVYALLGMGVGWAQLKILQAPKTVLTLPLIAHIVLALGRMSLGGPVALGVQTLVAVALWSLLAGTFVFASGIGGSIGSDEVSGLSRADSKRFEEAGFAYSTVFHVEKPEPGGGRD